MSAWSGGRGCGQRSGGLGSAKAVSSGERSGERVDAHGGWRGREEDMARRRRLMSSAGAEVYTRFSGVMYVGVVTGTELRCASEDGCTSERVSSGAQRATCI